MPTDILNQDIKYLKGVGPMRAKLLGDELRIFTLRDLLYTFPYKYVDRTVIHRICDLEEDMPFVQIVGELTDIYEEGTGHRKRLKAIFTDGTGYVDLVWFNQTKAVQTKLKFGQRYLLFGKPTIFGSRYNFAHPELDLYKPYTTPDGRVLPCPLTESLQPFYHTTEKMKRAYLGSRQMTDLMRSAFELVHSSLQETLPPHIVSSQNLLPIEVALRTLHFPPSADAIPAATHRMKFEELFYLQLDVLHTNRERRERLEGFLFPRVGKAFMTFYNEHLPFSLTGAQKRVIKEIRADLTSGFQMNRLLQGDVGSGKTMVALLLNLLAIDNDFQACLMAPTEILAEQHFESFKKLLEGMDVSVELLTGNVKGARRRKVLTGVAEGTIDILIGTHALIEPNVAFQNLGLVIIDEQHRFGVKQRAMLWEKNIRPPHVLVMTATPIPRTLAMTVYGDLDVSVIDELPPGRKPIQTLHYKAADANSLIAGIRHQLQQGRQVYVVYPLIEENEKVDLQDLENGYEGLCSVFPDVAIGRVHGRMKPAEKEATMEAFASGKTRILVATTVIEVGVNVPNATVMVIQNAERFGLSQLHQLRGRVGRGGDRSFCLLITKDHLSDATQRRISIMTETTDGFVIAEEDLKLRGPGSIQGTEQSGLPFDLRIADIVRDAELMASCREIAAKIIAEDPEENLPQNAIIWHHLASMSKNNQDFSNIS